jgi:hypothetical protein
MKDWNRKQFEKQKEVNLGKPNIKGEPVKSEQAKEIPYPGNKRWYTLEEAQALERYDSQHSGTGDTRRHWVNEYGEPVAFSY